MATIINEDNPFTLIPKSLSRNRDITPDAKAVYLFATTIEQEEEFTTHHIAQGLGMSHDMVMELVNELNGHGFMRFVVAGNES